MPSLIDSILETEGGASSRNPKFPFSPDGWTTDAALKIARQEGLKLGEEHWEAVRALQEYFSRHEGSPGRLRDLHDALDEKFHGKGGIKHLYQLFPGGPVAQGCRIAGLKVPADAVNKSFGSVA